MVANKKIGPRIFAAIAVLGVVLLIAFRPHARTDHAKIPVPSEETKAPTAISPRSVAVAPRRAAEAAIAPTPSPAEYIGDGIELSDGVPFHGTIIRLARQHPELNIGNPRQLQDAYSGLCDRRAVLEASIAIIHAVSPRQNLIEIPEYKEQGQSLLADLARYVQGQYGDLQAAKIMELLAPLFKGDNHDLGSRPLKLAITKIEGDTYDYQVVRETVILDPVTNQPIGAARGIDTMRKDNLGVYAKQGVFFPKG